MSETLTFPEAFCSRMKQLLPEEYGDFLKALAAPESVHALQLNPQKKISSPDITKELNGLPKVPYAEDSFICEGEGWGAHALHRAGAYYLQDPAAMGPVSALKIEKGWKVLDLCAAPGGKTAQLSHAVGNEGWVVANEMNPSRCRVLAGNVERLGLKNVMVMNGDGNYVASLFPSCFDVALVDAPCSGEGMFRKNPEALAMWNQGNVTLSAERQKSLLSAVADSIRPGGFLIYSTCTFSLEENENQVEAFLSTHSEFFLKEVTPALKEATMPGFGMPEARRFYPHRTQGEGQFVAVLQKNGNEERNEIKGSLPPVSREEEKIAIDFLKETLDSVPDHILTKQGNQLVLLPREEYLPPHCVFAPGVILGETQKKRLIPHHMFFSSFGFLCQRKISLSGGPIPWKTKEDSDSRLLAYLHGETISYDVSNGFGALLVDGCSLGGWKAVGGQLKNYYPKGLRI